MLLLWLSHPSFCFQIFAHTGRRQAAVTHQMTLMHAAEEQCTSMQALCNGAAGSQTLNAHMRAAAYQVC